MQKAGFMLSAFYLCPFVFVFLCQSRPASFRHCLSHLHVMASFFPPSFPLSRSLSFSIFQVFLQSWIACAVRLNSWTPQLSKIKKGKERNKKQRALRLWHNASEAGWTNVSWAARQKEIRDQWVPIVTSALWELHLCENPLVIHLAPT